MKLIRICLLSIFSLSLVILLGCGGGGGGGGSAATTGISFQENTGAIKGKITSSGIISENQRVSSLSQPGAIGVPGADVFLESDPTKKTISDQEGNFLLENVPEGEHNIIAKKDSGGNTFKMISNTIVVVKLQIVEIQK